MACSSACYGVQVAEATIRFIFKIDLKQFLAEIPDLEHFLKIVLYRQFWAILKNRFRTNTDLEQMLI